jgi:hypothetical protein
MAQDILMVVSNVSSNFKKLNPSHFSTDSQSVRFPPTPLAAAAEVALGRFLWWENGPVLCYIN